MESTKYTLSEQEKYRLATINAELKRRLRERTEEETIRELLSLSFFKKREEKEKIGA